MMQLATRVDDHDGAVFKETARRLGTTPSDAIRVFVAAFNACKGFPFDVRIRDDREPEPFATEEEATDFTTRAMKRALDEAR